MDYQTKKVLKYLNKNSSMKFSLAKLSTVFPDIDKDYLIEIIHFLNTNSYVKFIGDASIKSTNKGKTYFSALHSDWISKNIVSIFALIVSIIALFRTFN